jgi:dTDP-4-dehydrorhamnose reductase
VRVLVTGVSGQVGGALSRRLRAHDLVAADRAALDLSEPGRIAKRLDRLAPELIINAAAYTAVDKAEDDRDRAMLVNGIAPGVIARWAADHNVPLLHFSTDYVFDGSGDHPWREDDPPNPVSAYGASKLAGEDAVRAAGGVFLIVRTSWIYAAEGVNFMRTIVRLARERKELRIVSDQVGAPTSAASIAEAVAGFVADDLGAFSDRCARANGLVHFSAKGETSWHGFAMAIVEGLKVRGVSLAAERIEPIRSEQYPTRAARPLNSRLDLSRLYQVFAISPPAWRDALALELNILAKLLH